MNNLVSVIIPIGANEKPENVERTVYSLVYDASEEIEILLMFDGCKPFGDFDYPNVRIYHTQENCGERVTLNNGVKYSKGEYIFRIDAHCSMSYNWDVLLKEVCTENDIIFSIIDALDEKDWKLLNQRYTCVYINPSMEEKWWTKRYDNKTDTKQLTKSMSFTGCGWICKKSLYERFGGLDESYTKWGCLGPEITMKVYELGGRTYLHNDVTCGHVFSTNSEGYPLTDVIDTRKKLLAKYKEILYNLYSEFDNVPSWDNIDKKDYINNCERFKMENLELGRKEVSETKDDKGKLIKKVIKFYEPLVYTGEDDTTDDAVVKELTKNQRINKIKIADLINDKWDFTELTDENEIALWLFENE